MCDICSSNPDGLACLQDQLTVKECDKSSSERYHQAVDLADRFMDVSTLFLDVALCVLRDHVDKEDEETPNLGLAGTYREALIAAALTGVQVLGPELSELLCTLATVHNGGPLECCEEESDA